MKIPFNKPFLSGKELDYIKQSVESGKISGDGIFTKKCTQLLEEKYKFKKCLLTTSCTDALEMCALLADIQPGDEVIIPSYTFVSTANAFALRGAKIVFADSHIKQPNIDENQIEALITEKTKAIVVVHYAGVACNMDKIKEISKKHNLFLIEDAAQAIDSFYLSQGETLALGSIGDFAAFSFHETKNIISGEGGMITINDEKYILRAEIIREKGTNRSAFFRGEIDKYGWVDVGSSYLPSDINAAFLFAQIEKIDEIQNKRKQIWNLYYDILSSISSKVILPFIPNYATNNAHMFYLVVNSLTERDELISKLKSKDILSVFHYQSLHKSKFFENKHDGRILANSDRFTDCLLRLPLYFELSLKQVEMIANEIIDFYNAR